MMHAEREKPVAVFEGINHLSYCTKKRASQMVYRKKAKWIGYNKVLLLVTKEQEKEIRRKVRERDKCICYICDAQLTLETVTYDHIIPRSQGGSESVENLACCCGECNEQKADRSIEEYTLCLAAWIMYHVLLYRQAE